MHGAIFQRHAEVSSAGNRGDIAGQCGRDVGLSAGVASPGHYGARLRQCQGMLIPGGDFRHMTGRRRRNIGDAVPPAPSQHGPVVFQRQAEGFACRHITHIAICGNRDRALPVGVVSPCPGPSVLGHHRVMRTRIKGIRPLQQVRRHLSRLAAGIHPPGHQIPLLGLRHPARHQPRQQPGNGAHHRHDMTLLHDRSIEHVLKKRKSNLSNLILPPLASAGRCPPPLN